MQEKEPQYVNSIIRATAILELYEKLNVQYLGIAEISKELGIQKTTVFNIVKTLVHQGWLIQDNPNGKYRLGTRILRVSTMITRSITTEELIERVIRIDLRKIRHIGLILDRSRDADIDHSSAVARDYGAHIGQSHDRSGLRCRWCWRGDCRPA